MSQDIKSKSSPLPLPPPPPPPPPIPQAVDLNKQPKINETSVSTEEELNIASKRLLDEKFSNIFYTSNTFLKPQLQDGPQCGLVALSIASSVTNKPVGIDSIYEEAVSKGFTKQGEIFNASFLADLGESCGFKTKVLEGGLLNHLKIIIEILLKKNLLLVPYDADFNHSPCCKKGFKAHWAVITGFIIFEVSDETKTTNNTSESEELVLLNCLNTKSGTEKQINDSINLLLSKHQNKLLIKKISSESIPTSDCKKGEIYLIGLQGKSKHIGVWSFNEMTKSNENLLFFSSKRDSDCYIIPEGGPAMGLKGKAVVLEQPETE